MVEARKHYIVGVRKLHAANGKRFVLMPGIRHWVKVGDRAFCNRIIAFDVGVPRSRVHIRHPSRTQRHRHEQERYVGDNYGYSPRLVFHERDYRQHRESGNGSRDDCGRHWNLVFTS